jgi:hypothetical protein
VTGVSATLCELHARSMSSAVSNRSFRSRHRCRRRRARRTGRAPREGLPGRRTPKPAGSRPLPRRPLGHVRAIASTAAATVDLAVDRGMRATQNTTDRAGGFSSGYPARDLLTLNRVQTTLRPTAGPRPDSSHPLRVLGHRPLRHTEPATDLGLAHRAADARDPLSPRRSHGFGVFRAQRRY